MGNYDANLCTLTVDGRFITGFEDGSFISANKNEESFSVKTSAQGEPIISENNNPLGTIGATLSQTSPSYAYLQALAKSKKEFPIWVNYSGTPSEKAGGTRARIKKVPDKEYGNDAGSRRFEVVVFDYTTD